jgi:hypothetical protein
MPTRAPSTLRRRVLSGDIEISFPIHSENPFKRRAATNFTTIPRRPEARGCSENRQVHIKAAIVSILTISRRALGGPTGWGWGGAEGYRVAWLLLNRLPAATAQFGRESS